jgi:hypothetical protein
VLTELRGERSEACLSDLTFDAWRASELEPSEREAAEAHLAACQRCRERQQALDAVASEFLAQLPTLPPRSKAVSRARAAAAGRPSLRLVTAWATSLAAAAALLVWIGGGSGLFAPAELAPGTRIKGAERIGFFVRRDGQVFEGADEQRVRPRDQLRFVVSMSAARHVAILSRDAAGIASIYYPTAGLHGRLLAPAQSGPLDSAVELDDTLGREQLFGIFCPNPFELEPLRAQLEREAKFSAPEGCRVDRVELIKELP